MAAKGAGKGLYIILAAAVLLIAYQILRPASTRVEESRPGPADEVVGPPAIPNDVLRVPPALRGYGGHAATTGGHYWYLPYAVTSETQGLAMLEALRREVTGGHGFPDQLQVAEGAGALGTTELYRSEPGVSRFYITDMNNPEVTAAAEAKMPLIITQPNPGDDTAEVIYLDGHEEIVPMGKFPLSPAFIEALSALDPPEHPERKPGR